VLIKEDILKRCKKDDLYIQNDKEYYFCVGAILQDLKRCSKEFIKIEQSLNLCASPEAFDRLFKDYAKKCVITGLSKQFAEGSKKRKILAGIYAYKPETLDKDTFWDGFIIGF
jgi:hypothetical protein